MREVGRNDNQEDSLVFNRASIDRGLFRSMSLKKYITSIQKNQSTSQDDIFTKPDPTKVIGKNAGAYDKLNDKGYIPEETVIQNGDIILAKITPIQDITGSNKQFKDSSETYKAHVPGVVDRVYVGIQNQDGYETRKMLVRSERVPQIGDKYSCYTPEHEVLTSDGWKNIADVTTNDYLACLGDNDELLYEKPNEVMSYDIDDDVYVVESNQVSLRVTKNHRMYVSVRNKSKYEIHNAEDIYGIMKKYKKNVDRFEPDNLNRTVPDELTIDEETGMVTHFVIPDADKKGNFSGIEVPIDAWLIFFGIWIAEGSVSGGGVRIASHKERVRNAMDEAFAKMGYELSLNKDSKEDLEWNSYRCYDKHLTKYMTQFSLGAVNKFLPNWVWYLNREQCRALINGMMLGDGHTMENGTRRYDTSSKKLADDFQRLCLHAGYSCNIAVKYKAGHISICKAKGREGEIFKSTADAYRMTIIESQNEPLVNKNKGKGKQADRYEHYKGKVYCVNMNHKGVIYVRRDKIPAWSGNSRHGQKGTCGIKLPGIDMPFTKHGLRPDIIVNPNAIPSRMTIGQLVESLVGKVAAIDGYDADGTPFEPHDIGSIEKRLTELGYDAKGYEEMYNGMTGEKMKMKIFFGPTYYHRLKHLVQDKLHSRSRGPRTLLTHQPPEGSMVKKGTNEP